MIQPVSVFNQSSLVSADALAAYMGFINTVSQPAFAQRWGAQGELTLDRPNGAWAMWILDKTPIVGDLAFHMAQDGTPIMQIFAGTILAANASVRDCMEHELDEALADPTAAKEIPLSDGSRIVYEVCDPVSADLSTDTRGINFVTPDWFIPGSQGPWDFHGLCTEPLEVRPGGYTEKQLPGATDWTLSAMRDASGLYSWRIAHPGRLAYRARHY